ncbi:MAG: hypothetical protein M3Y24_04545 [Acidobacteriota bacterium]|nr:hypothetical protein [Acidobacteriota bacterium]
MRVAKTLVLMFALLQGAALVLFADGGTLVLRKQAGPFVISIFSSPETLRVGPNDFSAMVQRTEDQSSLLDATVKLRLTRITTEGISELYAPATHANATNKLLYAARVNVPSAGVWKLAADVETKQGNAEVVGEVHVLGPQPPLLAYWPYFAVVPLLIFLFVMNQWLKKRRRVRNRKARS